MRATMNTDLTGYYKQMAAVKMDLRIRLERTLQVVGVTLVDWLQSTGPEYGTRADPKHGHDRFLHPGGFGDITTNLSKRYGFKVIRTVKGYRLRLFNNAEYAVYIDVKEGYFVLDGVDEIARKEVEKSLKMALSDWKIRLQ